MENRIADKLAVRNWHILHTMCVYALNERGCVGVWGEAHRINSVIGSKAENKA